MKTVIFILAILALATPILSACGATDAKVSGYEGCETCDKSDNTAVCSKCLAGYQLNAGTPVKCSLCSAAGKGSANANTIAANAACDVTCHTTCGTCSATLDGTDSTKHNCVTCAVGYYLSDKTKGTCTPCNNGKGRAAQTTVAAASETVSACDVTCAVAGAGNCKGTGATDTLYCWSGHWATLNDAKTAITACTACVGKGRALVTSMPAATETADKCDVTCDKSCNNCKGTAATDCNWCAANYWWTGSACTLCADSKTKAAQTAMPAAAETADKCAAAGGSGSSATLIQALCGASVAAYALF